MWEMKRLARRLARSARMKRQNPEMIQPPSWESSGLRFFSSNQEEMDWAVMTANAGQSCDFDNDSFRFVLFAYV